MKRHAEYLARHPWAVIVATVLLTACATFPLSALKLDNSLDIWFSPQDVAYRKYQELRRTFGNDANAVIIYQSENLFTERQFELNRCLTRRLSALQNVKIVTSVSSLLSNELKGIVASSALSAVPRLTGFENIRELPLNNQLLMDNVLSRDKRATAINIELEKIDDFNASATVDSIRQVLAEPDFSENSYHLVGNIPLMVEMNRQSRRDSAVFVSITVAVIFLLLFFILGSLRNAMLPMAIAVMSVIWAAALYSLENSMNMVSSIMPLIILAVSVADAIHIVSQYQNIRAAGLPPVEAVIRTLGQLYLPCLFTSLTTIAAFLAFLSSDIPPLRAMGVNTAFGVAVAYLLSFTVLPSLLIVLDSGKVKTKVKSIWSVSWDRLMQLPSWVARHSVHVVVMSIVVVAVSSLCMLRLSFETDQIRYLKAHNPIRHGTELASKWFDGVYPIEMIVIASQEGYFFRRDSLSTIRELERLLKSEELVKTIFSPAIFIPQYKEGLSGSTESAEVSVIATKQPMSWTPSDSEMLRRFMSPDGKSVRISIRTSWLNNQQLESLVDRLKASTGSFCVGKGLSCSFTGYAAMYVDLNQRLIRSQIKSFALSFLLIFVMFWVISKRFTMAIIGMIPNVMPIMTTLGIMGAFGVKLDVATVLIAAITLGIAVDDTIHLMYAIDSYQKEGKTVPESLSLAMKHIGQPIVITSIVLIGGFSAMMLSSFLPLIYFGIFVSLNVLFALVYDIFVFPSVLIISSRSTASGRGIRKP